jgi:hypothetical protein
MYRRNLDILIAGVTALAGGAAYVAHLPSAAQIALGVALFFAPGYLWSEAILSWRLPPTERILTTAGLALILPILGGFLFFAVHIPLLRPDWVGLLVVLTLLGVVAVAVQRLREVPADPRAAPNAQRPDPNAQRRGQPPAKARPSALNAFVWAAAAVVALGSVAFSVKSAEAQKYPGYTMFWLTPVQNDPQKGSLGVTNHQGVAEQYQLKFLTKGKVTATWNFTLSDGQSWGHTVAHTTNYQLAANLYLLPDLTKPYRQANNGETPPPPTATPTAAKS